MAVRFSRRYATLVAAVLAPLAVCGVLVPFRSGLANTNVALVLVVVVVVVAATGHRLAGALAALFAAVWFDVFFTRPYEQLTIAGSADIQTAVLLLVVGLAVAQLAARARLMRSIAVTDAGYLARIHDTAALAHFGAAPGDVVERVRIQLVDVLSLRQCGFTSRPAQGHPPRLEQDGAVTWGSTRWDIERWGLPEDALELPVPGNGRPVGRFMRESRHGSLPSLAARLTAVTLAGEVGAALVGRNTERATG